MLFKYCCVVGPSPQINSPAEHDPQPCSPSHVSLRALGAHRQTAQCGMVRQGPCKCKIDVFHKKDDGDGGSVVYDDVIDQFLMIWNA